MKDWGYSSRRKNAETRCSQMKNFSDLRLTAAQLPSLPFPRRIHGLWPLLSRSGSWLILMRLRSTVSLPLRGGAGLLVEGSFTG